MEDGGLKTQPSTCTFAEWSAVVCTLITDGTVFALATCQQNTVMPHFDLHHPGVTHTIAYRCFNERFTLPELQQHLIAFFVMN